MVMTMNEICTILKFVCSIQFLRMSLLWTFSLLVSYLRLFFAGRFFGKKCAVYSRQKVTAISASQRPVCIVTGATSGLGAAAALALSKEGFFVILVGRSGYSLSKAMAEIRKLNEKAQLEAFEVDLSSFSSIMKFSDSIRQWLSDMNLHPSIQLLINNAGLLATSYRATSHGYDEMMMTNYMGAFSLTQLLLPLLLSSPVSSRIVNVSSFTHRSVNGIQVHKEFVCGKSFLNSKKYPFAQIYEYSKLYILLFSYKLHRDIISMGKASQLSVNVVDPGAVKTNIMREVPACLSQLAFSVLKLMQLLQFPKDGVSSILDACLAPPSLIHSIYCWTKVFGDGKFVMKGNFWNVFLWRQRSNHEFFSAVI
ncbi:short-chain dehydrogenase TIC 32 A, chloroplastic-like isoform X2 [Silene latifolia]|uniref:short-chain dehydrogenase TIC 32 A, chloroplastic-like isoform X2 n=1 Tax=Silene latifolia TaxID=37657 RepID=UPI003D78185E